jgi:hypothetical protein
VKVPFVFGVAFLRDETGAARILVVRHDYFVAAEIESALSQAQFDVIGVAKFRR